MRHPDDGVLRRLLDEPLAVSDVHRQHVAICPRCRVRSDQIAADAHAAARLMAVPAAPANSAAALAAFHRRVAAGGIAPARSRTSFEFLRRLRPGTRPVAGVAAGCALIAALVWTPAASLAQDFISLFQPTQIATVQTTTAELQSLQGLRKYGTIRHARIPPSTTAASAAAASAAQLPRVRQPPLPPAA